METKNIILVLVNVVKERLKSIGNGQTTTPFHFSKRLPIEILSPIHPKRVPSSSFCSWWSWWLFQTSKQANKW
jgi:hypothetical protein